MVSELISQRDFCTEAGTARFAARHSHGKAADAFNVAAQLTLSSLGIGTYLGASTDAADERYTAALVDAVRRGINVIDTASNYRCQRSERAVGQALQTLFASGEVFRSEILVASKAGFVSFDGCPPSDVASYMRKMTIDRGLCAELELSAGCHCIAPDFIDATLQTSLQNLNLSTIDVYFLHNPETQLQTLGKDDLDDRLRRAFERLELAADRGQIRVYGIATWSGLRAKPHERDHLSLERVLQCAHDVAGSRHRCRAVQLPMNLMMPEAFTLANQLVRGEMTTVLQAAQRLGLVVFGSGPLLQGKLAKRFPAHVPILHETFDAAATALQFARSLPGVTSTLVGMATMEHVVTNTALLSQPRAPQSWLTRAAQPDRQIGLVG